MQLQGLDIRLSILLLHNGSADLELELVERLRQGCVASDFIHKLAAIDILKDNAAGVLAQNEGQEGPLQALFGMGLDVHPVPVDAKGLGPHPACCWLICILLCLPGLAFLQPACTSCLLYRLGYPKSSDQASLKETLSHVQLTGMRSHAALS